MRRRLGSSVFVLALLGAFCVSAVGCTTYRDNLHRGQRLYQQNKYDDALALWRLMERDADALTRTEQAKYAYYRGMTDYQLGYRQDARHWLAVAVAIHEQEVGGLDVAEEGNAKKTLDELNREVYGLVPVDTESSTEEHAVEAQDESPAEGETESEAAEEAFCRVDADCSSPQICVANRCTAP